jgi:hypothetical protein
MVSASRHRASQDPPKGSHNQGRDLRKGSGKIGDWYDWNNLHHMHSVIGAFYSGCHVEPEAVGSCLALPVRTHGQGPLSDFAAHKIAETDCSRMGLCDLRQPPATRKKRR